MILFEKKTFAKSISCDESLFFLKNFKISQLRLAVMHSVSPFCSFYAFIPALFFPPPQRL